MLWLSPQNKLLVRISRRDSFLTGKGFWGYFIIYSPKSPQRLLLERALVCLERGVICTLPRRSGGHGTGLTGSEKKYWENARKYLRKSMNGR